jgi:choline dehydrogenase-like flavoprotein
VVLRAEALQLLTDDSASTVTGVEIACADGRRLQVAATSVVLAAGGVENARILLASRSVNPEGLGNEHDLVGRFFMEHWWVDLPLGDWGRGADMGLYDVLGRQVVDGTAVWAELVLSEALLRTERIPALAVWLMPRPQATASIAAARMLAQSIVGRVPADPITDLRLAATDVLEAPRYVGRRLASRLGADNRGYSLWVQLEQTPDPDNRVRLGPAEDELGRPTPELDLRLGEADLQGAERGLEIVAAELGLNGRRLAKQLRLSLAGRRYEFFWHHTGTTRMADDPTRGVVDRNCRVHGLSNLFVAGSSVFPTAGSAPPTPTIVALALRLADHLAQVDT